MRTAQAFVRYDRDGSGAIDIDEMRDALRKLGVKAGALEEAQLVRSPPPLPGRYRDFRAVHAARSFFPHTDTECVSENRERAGWET